MIRPQLYLGVDVGSVSTNLVIIDQDKKLIQKLYLRTQGNPINTLTRGMQILSERLESNNSIKGVGTTGSGRYLASVILGADVVKNEITAHAIAAQHLVPNVSTILEIGGQDSKIIIIRDGVANNFAMNTVCAAGTGSFLDRQAGRLGIPIEEFGPTALKSTVPVRIAGRCAVFAESDMIHKQQTGHRTEDIVQGLCEALVRNYLNNLAKGKEIKDVVVFQGGVAANIGIVNAFRKELNKEIVVPKHYDVMGAYGVAIIALQHMQNSHSTNFYGCNIASRNYQTSSMECDNCSNMCEVIKILSGDQLVAQWGDKCGKWSSTLPLQISPN